MSESEEDVRTILALMLTPGAGRATINRFLEASLRLALPPTALLHAPPRHLAELLAGHCSEIGAVVTCCSNTEIQRAARLLRALSRIGGAAIPRTSSWYSHRLEDDLGAQAPPLLFVLGDPALLQAPCAAVVGARDVSVHGARYAALCAESFTSVQAPVVSGGARGVDQTAHRAALRVAGKTLVVLPQGLLAYSLPRDFQKAVDRGSALVVSEFPPDSEWEIHAAVTRNATISALSRLVCVIEPKKTGGSIRTARLALEHRKRVLVYPASDCPNAAELLMRAGAFPLPTPASSGNRRYILRHWRSTPEPPQRQPGLF